MTTRTLQDQSLLRRFVPVLLYSIAVLAIAGCGIFSPEEAVEGGGGGETLFPLAYVDDGNDGLDQMIANLERAYEDRNIDAYDEILHEDYLFRIDPNEIGIIGQETFTRTEDYNSTKSMFAKEEGEEPVLDENGQPTGEMQAVPGVSTIRLRLTPVSGSEWALIEGGEFDGTRKRIYEVDMTVTYIGGRVDTIVGKQVFYVLPGQVDRGGAVASVWQLRAWEDQGIAS